LIEFTVEGKGPGEEIDLANSGTVRARGRVWGIVAVETIELVVDGNVVRTWQPDGDGTSFDFDVGIDVSDSGWIHLRVAGNRDDRWPLDTAYPQAFTNPVWVTVADRPIRSASAADYAVRWIDKLQAMADEWPGWRAEREREHVFAQFEAAREIYRRRGAEAGPNAGGDAVSAPTLPTVVAQPSGVDAVLQAISPVSDDVVWIGGHEGTILLTQDGGAT